MNTNLLKSLIDSMEGYPESIKFLHKNNDWNHNAPILSDIIYVKEEYRAAVENVLEPYLNYYVVNNLEEGLMKGGFVHLLDDNKKKGRPISFYWISLPISKTTSPSANFTNYQGFAGHGNEMMINLINWLNTF